MDALTFYRGLLFAVRAKGETTFVASGSHFHRAFGEAARFAKAQPPSPEEQIPLHLEGDRAFGTFDEAEELVLEGEMDRIHTLVGPALRRACFRMSQDEAARELAHIGNVDWFSAVADRFIACNRGA